MANFASGSEKFRSPHPRFATPPVSGPPVGGIRIRAFLFSAFGQNDYYTKRVYYGLNLSAINVSRRNLHSYSMRGSLISNGPRAVRKNERRSPSRRSASAHDFPENVLFLLFIHFVNRLFDSLYTLLVFQLIKYRFCHFLRPGGRRL